MPLTSVLNWLKVKIFMTVILKTAKSSTREARNNVDLSQFSKRCLKTVTGRFANVSVRQRPVRQRMKSFRQRLMSVRQHL